MKFFTLILLSFSILLFSCESGEDSGINNYDFRLELSDGTQISEKNIQYYDSTTHLLFLKSNLDLKSSFKNFWVLVNNDTIYKGQKHSCYLSSPPKTTFSIGDCSFYGLDVLEVAYCPYSPDIRNDNRIINAFKESKLLRSGITCTLDSVKIKNLDNHAEISCKITLTNHDRENYYIIDPGKMGELDFNYYTGGLSFHNFETKIGSFMKWSVSNTDYWKLSNDDFSVLKGNSKVSFTFKSSDYYKVGKGLNRVIFGFKGWNSNSTGINLSQKNGRVWVGKALAIDSVLVE